MEQPFDTDYAQSNPAPVSVGEWVVTYLITMIPLVGLIMLFVWAFGNGANPSKANWAKAGLVIAAVIIVLYILFFALFGAALMSSFGNL